MGTVLLTGASGYLGKHVALQLAEAGWAVRASVRSAEKGDAVKAAVAKAAGAEVAGRIEVVILDLTRDEGWAEAVAGVDAVLHTASPFPMVQPKDPAELIRPAVDGALRAARAARDAGVGRFVMTSSTVAVMGRPLPAGKAAYDEADWTDGDDPGQTPYGRSKALAERAVWDFAASEAQGMAVTMINPGFIVGPPLDGDYGTSIAVIERLLRGKDPLLPDFGFVCVDVRDVAALHVAALTTPGAEGKRVLAVARFMKFVEMARVLKAAIPSRRIPTRVAPNFVVRVLGLFDKAIAQIVPELGKVHEVSNAQAREVFGIAFRDVSASVVETGQAVIGMGRV